MAQSNPSGNLVFDYPFSGNFYPLLDGWALRIKGDWHFEDTGDGDTQPYVTSVSFSGYGENLHGPGTHSWGPGTDTYNNSYAWSNYGSIDLCHDAYVQCTVNWVDCNGASRVSSSSTRKFSCPPAGHKPSPSIPSFSFQPDSGIVIDAKLTNAGSGMYDAVAYSLYHHSQPGNQGSIVSLDTKVFNGESAVDSVFGTWKQHVLPIYPYEAGKKVYYQTHGTNGHGNANSDGPPASMPSFTI